MANIWRRLSLLVSKPKHVRRIRARLRLQSLRRSDSVSAGGGPCAGSPGRGAASLRRVLWIVHFTWQTPKVLSPMRFLRPNAMRRAPCYSGHPESATTLDDMAYCAATVSGIQPRRTTRTPEHAHRLAAIRGVSPQAPGRETTKQRVRPRR